MSKIIRRHRLLFQPTSMIRKGGMVTVNPFSEAWKRKMNTKPTGPVYFGPFEVTPQVFLTTPHSFALVNLKPLLPGHVLVCPLEPHKRLTDLSAPELTDLFQAVQRVQRMLARHYFTPSSTTTTEEKGSSDASSPSSSTPAASPEAGSFNLAIQDGSGAGQTVPHVHVHVIPRIAGETEKDGATVGDAVYEQMAAEAGNVGGALWDRDRDQSTGENERRPVPGGGFARIEDADRRPRSAAEMAAEADVFRGVLAAVAREEAEKEKEKEKVGAGDGDR